MICIDYKFLNLFHLLKAKYPNELYIKFNPEFGIKIITNDETLYKQIQNLTYFKNNNFFIKTYSYDFSPNMFFITMQTPLYEDAYLNKVYEDYLKIYDKFNVNISMINEKGFSIITNDIEIINEIYDMLNDEYDYTKIQDNHIFLIK